MSTTATLLTELSAETLASVQAIASERGTSAAVLAGDLLREAVADDACMRAAITEGRAQIAAGDCWTHEQLVADLQRWKQDRKRIA